MFQCSIRYFSPASYWPRSRFRKYELTGRRNRGRTLRVSGGSELSMHF